MMNKKVVTIGCLSLAILMGGTTFTSCSNNDDEPSVVFPIDKDLAGNYLGDLKVTVSGNATDVPSTKVTISKGATDNTITLNLKGFSFMGLSGDISLANLALADAGDGTYTFSGSTKVNFAGMNNLPVEAKNGKIGNGKVSVDLVIAAPVVGDVTVNYAGNKLTGSESSDATIKAFTFNNDVVTDVPVVDNENGTITFNVAETATEDELKSLEPVIVLNSDKATITPTGPQDFSKNKSVTYTVTAEDGTKKEYKASVAGTQSVLSYSFEEWGNDQYDVFSPQPTDQLATSSDGTASLSWLGWKGGNPVTQITDDVKDGKSAAKLVTFGLYKDLANYAALSTLVPPLAAGSLFTGKFDTGPALTDPLMCTLFGIPYDKEPLYFKGWYKYTPGAEFVDGTDRKNIKVLADKTDECTIQAVLYEAVDGEGNEITLNGHDIDNSQYRVAVAQLSDGTAKSDWTSFNIPFKWLDGKSYDKSKKYKLAIVCSSSKQGAAFIGAAGSTLIIDGFEVIGK